jgi:hypothetical protein
LFSPA